MKKKKKLLTKKQKRILIIIGVIILISLIIILIPLSNREHKNEEINANELGRKLTTIQEVVEYLEKKINIEEMINKIKQESRRYAKRQITWFKTYKNAVWLDAENKNNVEIIMNSIKNT